MSPTQEFEILEEKLAYKRYLPVYHRLIKFPDSRQVHWDIVGSPLPPPHFATVFPFFSKPKKVRMILEYAQGINQVRYTLVAGGFDPSKHSSITQTAEHELSEEAHLQNGRLIPLLPLSSPGIAELKWCRNMFLPFLCIDPEEDVHPRERDAEEFMSVEDVEVEVFQRLCLEGKVLLPAVQTGLMAIDYLKRNGYLD